ncbi:MAG: 1,2-phenylacetyl-CoA epoxidase subunit PaaD [Bacteriovoracia bacterium]
MVTEELVWQRLVEVTDPEVPVLSVLDLGIVRSVRVEAGAVEVTITPTYSGCPAMNTIEADIKNCLMDLGPVTVVTRLSPAWTTDWMSEEGKRKLKDYGIAPPVEGGTGLFQNPKVACPRCESQNTKMLAQFGSTSCKAMYQCQDCFEPFDYFKCHR